MERRSVRVGVAVCIDDGGLAEGSMGVVTGWV